VVCEQTAVLGSVLQPGASVEVAFPELSLAFGVYMVSCSTVQAADNNPANDRATGWFVVDNDIGARAVEVRIYNRAGEFIRSLAFAATVGSPSWVTWDGRNEQGRRVAPGTYLCLIAARALTDEPAEERCCPVLVTRDANEVRLRWRQQ
jgi:hypothetical protein